MYSAPLRPFHVRRHVLDAKTRRYFKGKRASNGVARDDHCHLFQLMTEGPQRLPRVPAYFALGEQVVVVVCAGFAHPHRHRFHERPFGLERLAGYIKDKTQFKAKISIIR